MPQFSGHTHARRIRHDSEITSGSGTAPRQPAPTHREIAELAFSYWEARGGRGGSAWEDWFRAERELAGKKQV